MKRFDFTIELSKIPRKFINERGGLSINVTLVLAAHIYKDVPKDEVIAYLTESSINGSVPVIIGKGKVKEAKVKNE
jgi:hypothetical protein